MILSREYLRVHGLVAVLASVTVAACGNSDSDEGPKAMESAEDGAESSDSSAEAEEERGDNDDNDDPSAGDKVEPGGAAGDMARSDDEEPAADDGSGEPAGDGSSECQTFENSFDAIQKLIFERRGCTADACHGEAKVGGLDLRAAASYESLVDAPSSNNSMARVQPGTSNESFLYNKLAAATDPERVKTTGSPMPVGTDPLTAEELQAINLWIIKGAPKTGVVADLVSGVDLSSLLDACLPPAKPVMTKPLEPPAAEEGVQFLLPAYVLKAGTEIEQCIPFAYDFSDRVPAEYKDEARNVMFVNGSRVRQDPQSHHLVVWNPIQGLSEVPADEAWTCHGGERDGEVCDPSKGSSECGAAGVCAGAPTPGTLCGIDVTALSAGGLDGVPEELRELLASGGLPAQVANSQSPQEYIPPIDGVFWEMPLSGVLWFNTHAFNLSDQDTVLNARMNFYYAKSRQREMKPVNVIDNNYIADGQAPFTRETYCAKYVVPQDYSIAILTGHTHRRGERFWVTNAAGEMIYENFSYSDPIYKRFEPWMVFDSPSDADRTLEYCATYSNGLTADDQFDTDLVTRASRMPERTSCEPVACVAGKVGQACSTDQDCDSMPSADDGFCDACTITKGTTTENEMFVLMPWFVLPEAGQ